MNLICNLFIALLFSLLSTRHICTAQDEFGQVLLQAFTTGIFDGPPQQQPSAVGPTRTPDPNAFSAPSAQPAFTPEVLLPMQTSEMSPERTMGFRDELGLVASVEPTVEFELLMPSVSPNAEVDALFDSIWPSLFPVMASPEASPEMLPFSSPEPSAEPVLLESSPDELDVDAVINVYQPVMVNCGSFDVRNGDFGLDTESWFNEDSYVISEPFAETLFGTFQDSLLYSTYRYSDANLTYTVPVEVTGVWKVTLQWAEIAASSMREGARVFSVIVNGKELHSEIDVYRDSAFGSFSPLARTHIIDVFDPVITIVLGQKVGQPMLSGFQLTYESSLQV